MRIHVSYNGTRYPYNPHDSPPSADHFVLDFRSVLPSLKVYKFDVPSNGGADTGRPPLVPTAYFAANEALARNLQSPRAVVSMLANPGRHIMSRSSYRANLIMDC